MRIEIKGGDLHSSLLLMKGMFFEGLITWACVLKPYLYFIFSHYRVNANTYMAGTQYPNSVLLLTAMRGGGGAFSRFYARIIAFSATTVIHENLCTSQC